jgi:hypothetical protein
MTTIATLAVKLIADASAFTQALDVSERKAQAWSARVSQSITSVGGAMINVGMRATTFLTLPLLGAGIAAVNFASDLEETKNKVTVVFGSMSGSVMTWSQTSATAMGMSQNTALSAAGTFGNLFTTMGIGQSASADMSMGLVQLASDLASFNNLDPTNVLEKLRSGLVGEVEPLRTLGINLSQSAVEAKAMETGLAGTDGQLNASALAQARYALILEQSGNAAGDFARTSSGLANQQRILKAQFQNAGAALGGQLLPYALRFVQWVSGLIAKFQALTPTQQKWIIGIAAAVAVIGPLLMIIGSLVTAIGAIIGVIGAITAPILIVIAVIAALVAVGYLLYQAWINNWGGIQQKVAAVWAWLQPIFSAIRTWLATNIPLALAALGQFWTTVLLPAIQSVWGWLEPKLAALWAWLATNIPLAISALSTFWTTVLLPAIQSVWAWLEPKLIGLWTWLATNIPLAISALSSFWTTVLLPAIQSVWSFLSSNVFPLFVSIANFMSAAFGFAVAIAAFVWRNVFLPAIQGVWSWMNSALFPTLQKISSFISSAFSAGVQLLANAWSSVLFPAIKKVIEFFQTKVMPVLKPVAAFLSTQLASAFEAVRKIIDAITAAIKKMTAALNAVTIPPEFVPGSPTPFELGLLGIHAALMEINTLSLPSLQTQFSTTGSLAFASAGAAGMAGGDTYNISINGIQMPGAGRETSMGEILDFLNIR